jgi:hypothetical protein
MQDTVGWRTTTIVTKGTRGVMKKLLLSLAAMSLLGVGAFGNQAARAQDSRAAGATAGDLVRLATPLAYATLDLYVVVSDFTLFDAPVEGVEGTIFVGAAEVHFTGNEAKVEHPNIDRAVVWSEKVLTPGTRLHLGLSYPYPPGCGDVTPPEECLWALFVIKTVPVLNK